MFFVEFSQLIEDLKVQLTDRSNEQQQIIDRQAQQITAFLNEQKTKMSERDEDLVEQRNRLEQENHLFANAIEQWAQRYAEMKEEKEHLTK